MKKITARLVTFLIIFFLPATIESNAQNSFYKYNYVDTSNIGNGRVVESIRYQGDFIIAGSFTDKFNDNPSVKRVDTLGNVLWSSTTSDNDPANSNNCLPFVQKIILVDSFIYYISKYNYSWPYHYRITKMNANSGLKIWQTVITNLEIGTLYDLKDLNSSEVGFYYYSGNPNYKMALCKVNKASGIATNFNIGGQIFNIGGQQHGMCIDNNNNIYVTKADSIIKLNGTTMNTIWAQSYTSSFTNTVQMHNVIYTPSDSVIAFTYDPNLSANHTSSFSVNKSTGNMQWSTPNTQPSSRVTKSLVQGNYLYNIFRAASNPQAFPFRINKIDITNGSEVWSNSFTLNATFDKPIFNIEFDNNHGYCIANDYCAGLVMKLDLNNGNLINNTSLPYNYCNQSLKTIPQIHLQNGSLYTISSHSRDTLGSLGNFEPVELTKMNPANLAINKRTPIDGNYHFSSRTIDIKDRANNKKLVLKKTGKSGELIMYNASKQIMWKHKVGQKFYSDFGPIAFTNDGRIVVTSLNHAEECTGTYYTNPTSLSLEYFDSTGVSLYKNIQPYNTAYNFAAILPDTGYHAMLITHSFTAIELNEFGISNTHFLINTNYSNLPQSPIGIFAITSTIDSFTYINITESNAIKFNSYNISNNSSAELKTLATNKKGSYYKYIPAQNCYILGTEQTGLNGPFTVEKFDNSTNTTAWSATVTYPIKKIVTDLNNQFIYVIINKNGWPLETILYKIDMTNGAIVWQRTNGIVANSIPLEFYACDLDISSNRVSVSAANRGTNPKRIGLFRYDLNGTLVDSFISNETNLSLYHSNKLARWSNGSHWLYGAVDDGDPLLFGNTRGIIYDTDSIAANQTTYSNISQTSCDSFIFNNQTITTSGIYNDTLFNSNANGADSIITMNLTINQASSSTISQTACNSFMFNSQTLTLSGTYYDTTTNAVGCDSITTLNLTINVANTGITVSGTNLSATAGGAIYQWIKCNPITIISNATSQNYTASTNGDYAVIITQNGCTDTSACIAVIGLSINKFPKNKLQITPNPTTGEFVVSMLEKKLTKGEIKIISLTGQLVHKVQISNNTKEVGINISEFPSGIYFVEVIQENNIVKRIKLLKQ